MYGIESQQHVVVLYRDEHIFFEWRIADWGLL